MSSESDRVNGSGANHGLPRRRSGMARWICPSVLIGLVAVLIAWWMRGDDPSDPPSESRPIPAPPLSESPFRSAIDDVQYVGSDRCITCHLEQHQSYLETFHSRSMGIVDPHAEPPGAAFDYSTSGRRYAVRREAGRLWHVEMLAQRGTPVELQAHALTYHVGSGHFGKSYLTHDDGFLVQSPITWYTPRQEWDMSPGYDTPRQVSFQRTVSTECLFCHAGAFEAIGANPHKPQIRELAIGCERCHGPGSLHVERWTTGDDIIGEDDDTIVHPRRLPRELSEAICAQCHLQGDVQVAVRGRALDEFRPGLPLDDFRYEFRMQAPGQEMTIVGHVEQLHASRCYQESQTLTCITCHDPHRAIPPERRDTVHREACLTCHQSDSCGLEPHVRQSRADDRCVECHMPSSETEVPHVAFTHHRIGIHPAPRQPAAELSAELVTVQDLSHLPTIDRDRVLGLAYWAFYRKHADDPQWNWCAARAAQLLELTAEAGLGDPAVGWALAEIAVARNRNEMAVPFAEHIIATEARPTDERTQALRFLSSMHFREQRFERAYALLEELVRVRRNATDWFYLGLTAQNLGRTDDALNALEHSLSIDPAQAGSHLALAALYESRGDRERAEFHRVRATQLAQPR